MGEFVRLTAEALQVVTAFVAAYLAIGLVSAFLDGQLAASTGKPVMLADVMVRAVVLVICLAIVVFARPVANEVAGVLEGGVDLAGIRPAVVRIGGYFLDVLIGVLVVLAVVGIALGFVDGQLRVIVGDADAMALAIARVVGVIVMLLGGLLAMWLVHLVVGRLSAV